MEAIGDKYKPVPDVSEMVRPMVSSQAQDLALIARNLYRYQVEVNELRGQNLLICVGLTGSGKSTMCQALADRGSIENDEDYGIYLTKKDRFIKYNNRTMFEICGGSQSKTKIPGFFPIKNAKGEKIYIVDTPGVCDTVRTDEMPNQVSVHNLMKHAKSLKMALCFSASDVQSERGANLLKICTQFVRNFTDDGIFYEAINFIQPLCCNYGSLESKAHLLAVIDNVASYLTLKIEAFEKIKNEPGQELMEQHKESLRFYSGLYLPADSELSKVKALLLLCQEKIVVADPCDEFFTEFEDIERTMEQLQKMLFDDLPGRTPKQVLATDMHTLLHAQMKDAFRYLYNQEGALRNDLLIAQIKDCVRYICEPYIDKTQDNPNVNSILKQLESFEQKAKRRVEMKWHKKFIVPAIDSVFQKQSIGDHGSTTGNELFWRYFLGFYDKNFAINEEDLDRMEYDTFQDWINFLYENAAEFEELYGNQIQAPESGVMTTVREAFKYLKNHIDTLSGEEGEQAEDARSFWCNEFIMNFMRWLNIAWPYGYEIRNQKAHIQTLVAPDSTTWGDKADHFFKTMYENEQKAMDRMFGGPRKEEKKDEQVKAEEPKDSEKADEDVETAKQEIDEEKKEKE